MSGLTWGDQALLLTPLQWGAVVGNCAGWLWQWRSHCSRIVVACLTCGLLWGAFWDVPIGRDQKLLLSESRKLQGLAWSTYLNTFSRRSYLEFQTPFYPFFIACLPVYWRHQIYLFPLALAAIALLFALYGEAAALLCATPLFGLIVHQPSTDWLLFVSLLCVLRLGQLGQPFWGAVVYGLTWLIKPLTILTLPFLLGLLQAWTLLAVSVWAGYVVISSCWAFGQHQLDFLLHQLFIRRMTRPRPGVWQVQAIKWRWLTIGRQSLTALPWYLFPAYCHRWRWGGVLLLAIILAGYGNIKYQLLTLLFIFPLQEGGRQ